MYANFFKVETVIIFYSFHSYVGDNFKLGTIVPTASKVQCVLTFNGQPVQFADIFKIEGKEQYFSLKPLEVLFVVE